MGGYKVEFGKVIPINNNNMEESKLVDGLYFDKPREGSPEWVKGKMSIKKDQFLEWITNQETNQKGYINIDLLLSKKNTLYFKVNDWQPDTNK